ncbi:MAG: MoxR family ATPase [Myxococcales bacterium]|nr:MoxR family ATPase [Myxococcales bacterium]
MGRVTDPPHACARIWRTAHDVRLRPARRPCPARTLEDAVNDTDLAPATAATPAAGDATLRIALDHGTLAAAVALRDRVTQEVARVYIGSPDTVALLFAALLARGHVLLEGVPGLAKTTLAKAVAVAVGCDFRRIQFTPDLLPADITGTFVFNQKAHEFELRRGPLFAQVVLADEINRAPAKTQSALLEAMQERQVTIEGATQLLPDPFLVLATQNPVEQEGVYVLPEAQIDRFLIRIRLEYPSARDEVRMLQTYDRPVPGLAAVTTVAEVQRTAAAADAVHVEEKLLAFAVRLVQATRAHPRVALGASPRATLGLVRLAKAWALLQGRDFVTPDDLRQLAAPALEHRIMVTTDAAIEGVTAAAVLRDVLARTRLQEGQPGVTLPRADVHLDLAGA